MRTFLLCLGLACVWGCAEKPEPIPEPPTGEQTSASTNTSGGGNDSIGIISPAAGTSAPVTNTDTVQGAGGGSVGAAAKGQAHKAAEKMGGSSLDQMGNDGN